MQSKVLVSKLIEMKWNPANRKRYEGLGYTFTQWGDRFFIDIKDLSKTSGARVEVKCDECGRTCNGDKGIDYKSYNRVISKNNGKYFCRGCVASGNSSYGKRKPKYPREILIKMLQERYEKGLECNSHALQKDDHKLYDAIRYTKDFETVAEIYEAAGIDYSKVHKRLHETSWSRDLVIEKFLERYNEDPMKCNSSIIKQENNALLVAIRREFGSLREIFDFLKLNYNTVIKNKLYINGIKASQPQIDLANYLNLEVNVKIKNKYIDIVDKKNKLAIEYDGGGHRMSILLGKISEEKFNKKEKNMERNLIKNGWRFIRIKNEKDLPLNYNIIKEAIDESITLNKNHVLIELS